MDDLANKSKSINVMVVEDTPVQMEFICYLMEKDPRIHVIETARDGIEAIRLLRYKRPDVLLMDINMPNMNGYDASKKILESYAIPIILMTASWGLDDVSKVVKSMKLGIVMAINKPHGINYSDLEIRRLIDTIKMVSEIKIVRRNAKQPEREKDLLKKIDKQGDDHKYKAVVIGSSAGGPPALQKIISKLPADFSIPILVVQHMSSGFCESFAHWLDNIALLNVTLASDGQEIRAGHVYIAPDDHDMMIKENKIVLDPTKKESYYQPTISALFESAFKMYGKDTIAVILSGMGDDGVKQMKVLKEAGALTIAQDKESSIVFGMPGEAAKHNAAVYQLSPKQIGVLLKKIVYRKRRDDE